MSLTNDLADALTVQEKNNKILSKYTLFIKYEIYMSENQNNMNYHNSFMT